MGIVLGLGQLRLKVLKPTNHGVPCHPCATATSLELDKFAFDRSEPQDCVKSDRLREKRAYDMGPWAPRCPKAAVYMLP